MQYALRNIVVTPVGRQYNAQYMSTESVETASQGKKEVVRALRKKTLGGALYTRDSRIEAKLSEILALPPDELVARCAVKNRKDPAYVPSECLLYVVRTCQADDAHGHFGTLYKLLMDRVLRRLPTGESADGKNQSLPESRVREELFDRFTVFLAKDRTTYAEHLDYFELRFDGALLNLRRDVQRKSCREPKEFSEIDPITGEIALEVERAAGVFDAFDPAEMDRADYRSRLNEAIKSLPIEQRTIVEMIGNNIPIDSKDPSAVTIAKTLGRSEKTIRLHRDQAYLALETMLKKGKVL